MAKCSECEYSKLDELWGDFMCLKRQHAVYDHEKFAGCGFYESKKTKETKEENTKNERR